MTTLTNDLFNHYDTDYESPTGSSYDSDDSIITIDSCDDNRYKKYNKSFYNYLIQQRDLEFRKRINKTVDKYNLGELSPIEYTFLKEICKQEDKENTLKKFNLSKNSSENNIKILNGIFPK